MTNIRISVEITLGGSLLGNAWAAAASSHRLRNLESRNINLELLGAAASAADLRPNRVIHDKRDILLVVQKNMPVGQTGFETNCFSLIRSFCR